MLKLLGRKTSGNVQKVIFMLEEIGAEYERQDYGRQFENTQTPEYKALNPTSKVPTLVDDDVVIWESNTILRYLADTRAAELTGSTPAERTQVERWMDFLLSAINPGYMAAFKGSKLAENERPPEFAGQVADLHAQMALIDAALDGQPFLALGKLTIADIACGPILARCLDFPLQRAATPNLDAWRARLAERDAFQAATG